MDISMEEEISQSSERDSWHEEIENFRVESAVMNKLVMNYLVTEGFKEAAGKFEQEAGINAGICLDDLDARIEIRDTILSGSVQKAISLINDVHPELLDNDRVLLFYLQLQHLIELIRELKTEEALEFAQTQLSECGGESQECLSEMERVLALLVFDKPDQSPFADLLLPSQRHKAWTRVNTAILDYENNVTVPKIANLVKLLMWSQDHLDKKRVRYPKMTNIGMAEYS